MFSPCLLALSQAAAATVVPVGTPSAPPPRIAYAPVLDAIADAQISPTIAGQPRALGVEATRRALQPTSAATAFAEVGEDVRLGKGQLLKGGKLLLTNGVTTVEGSSGGGIARWATIAGRQMPGGIGLSSHITAIELPHFGWRSYGLAVGFGDRLELSYSHADFDTRDAGALLGIGQGYTFNLDTYGAKLRVAGDVVYGDPWLPQIAVGIEHKRSGDSVLVRALGAVDDTGTDYTLSATKLLLAQSLLINGTLRYTKSNALGLLGFGSANHGYKLQFEGTLGFQVSRRAVVGAEYRSKPDNLDLGGSSGWMDIFAAYALTGELTVTAAYVDLGSIATFSDQRGGFLSAQVAF